MAGVAGCGGVGDLADAPPPAAYEEVQFASDTYLSCIVNQARRLDDGKGTPIAVALRIAPLCQMQFAYLQEASSRGSGPVAHNGVRDDLKQANEAFVASIMRRLRLQRELGP